MGDEYSESFLIPETQLGSDDMSDSMPVGHSQAVQSSLDHEMESSIDEDTMSLRESQIIDTLPVAESQGFSLPDSVSESIDNTSLVCTK
ncbi:hypothetical protein SARC_11246 [Sphaeroforma arctica JP610]|uniref:Uncharacterized protein n=1 Tax=Sphaeroforma arctica JP610 TaxID=667725 RepID=A0A0L0FHJ1_9EUKA|nr:hypothetical protein SARC_11246 [Sphaeroforma arctica JP610]KNC76247.1 hypothetical protein SARC_11246 [Sphaeroforma arctica JP610]|eukprot:XP_014150149.1 hypothetical protein SARC_11246 [Sphaeroforma arctica JP610]